MAFNFEQCNLVWYDIEYEYKIQTKYNKLVKNLQHFIKCQFLQTNIFYRARSHTHCSIKTSSIFEFEVLSSNHLYSLQFPSKKVARELIEWLYEEDCLGLCEALVPNGPRFV